jgi:hypothetical protein
MTRKAYAFSRAKRAKKKMSPRFMYKKQKAL